MRSRLIRHITKHVPNTASCAKVHYRCPHCSYTGSDGWVFKQHLTTHVGQKPYECNICYSRYTRVSDLRSHVVHLHGNDGTCLSCHLSFDTGYQFLLHMHTHEEQLFRCEICLYTFTRRSQLRSHLSTHSDGDPLWCGECGLLFEAATTLLEHRQLCHGSDVASSAAGESDLAGKGDANSTVCLPEPAAETRPEANNNAFKLCLFRDAGDVLLQDGSLGYQVACEVIDLDDQDGPTTPKVPCGDDGAVGSKMQNSVPLTSHVPAAVLVDPECTVGKVFNPELSTKDLEGLEAVQQAMAIVDKLFPGSRRTCGTRPKRKRPLLRRTTQPDVQVIACRTAFEDRSSAGRTEGSCG